MARKYHGEVMEIVFLIQLFASFFLCGLIWIVQLVHYPAFRYVDHQEFIKFEFFHTRNISFIVVPIMMIELVSALLLIQYSVTYASLFSLNLGLVLAVWLVTFAFSVPCHQRLSRKKDEASINMLVRTNWIRTFIWTVKAILLLYMCTLVFNISL